MDEDIRNIKRNLIDERFDNLLVDIETDYKTKGVDGDVSNPKFMLWIYSAEELISMGFCHSNVDKVMENVGDSVVDDYFDNVVAGLTAENVGGIELQDSAGCTTIGQFIMQVKRQAVKSSLNIMLSRFISKLKGGTDNGTIN